MALMSVMRHYIVFILAFAGLLSFSNVVLAVDPPDISPDPLEFPDTRVGQTSDPLTITITNVDTNRKLNLGNIVLVDTTNFSKVSDPCANTILNKNAGCDLTVEFTPGNDGHFSTGIAVYNNSSDSVNFSTIEGRGVEPKVTLSRTSIDFGDQPVDTTSAEQAVTMVNSGDEELTITEVAASDDFDSTDDCGAALAESASCGIGVTFLPTSEGGHAGQVVILDDAPGSPHTISLSGTGVVPGSPGLSLSATSADFGNQTVETTSDPVDVVVTSTGTVDLVISSVTASENFAEADNCVGNLAPAAQCTISITFTPPSVAVFSGNVLIENNTADSPEQISLLGDGTNVGPDTPHVNLSATILEFGNVTKNFQSDPQMVTVENDGTDDLVVDSVVVGGLGEASFSKFDDCHGKTIPADSTCEIVITFSPVDVGPQTASLTISDNTADSPQLVTLNGTGVFGTNGGCSLIY
jgi:hypothetical protein